MWILALALQLFLLGWIALGSILISTPAVVEPGAARRPLLEVRRVFLSFRHLSALMLYRPSTSKVIWFREGLTFAQHDVQILDDHRIAVFDNNTKFGSPERVSGYNRAAIFDFASDQISHPFDRALKREKAVKGSCP